MAKEINQHTKKIHTHTCVNYLIVFTTSVYGQLFFTKYVIQQILLKTTMNATLQFVNELKKIICVNIKNLSKTKFTKLHTNCSFTLKSLNSIFKLLFHFLAVGI